MILPFKHTLAVTRVRRAEGRRRIVQLLLWEAVDAMDFVHGKKKPAFDGLGDEQTIAIHFPARSGRGTNEIEQRNAEQQFAANIRQPEQERIAPVRQ